MSFFKKPIKSISLNDKFGDKTVNLMNETMFIPDISK